MKKQDVMDAIKKSGVDILYPIGSQKWTIAQWINYLKVTYGIDI